jgi:hypothetical protein
MASTPSERVSLLVIRMWLESADPASFRSRVSEMTDPHSDARRSEIFGTPDETVAFVTEQIRSFAGGDIWFRPGL